MHKEEFLFRLSLCPGLGPVSRYQLWQAAQKLSEYCDLVKLSKQLGWKTGRIKAIAENWVNPALDQLVVLNEEVPHVLISDPAYPKQLKEIYCPPLVLYYHGDWSLTSLKGLAVVGARNMTDYGKQAMQHLLPAIVSKKLVTISGLARGIDGLCHQISMDYGGRTIGVIGTGIDISYPQSHLDLQKQMAEKQLVISEYPLGSRPLPYHFPERNRIIAGLAHSCLVVQARKKSGSLITSSIALQENRNVLAVPGRLGDPFSEGTNQLIAAGARPALNPADILDELNLKISLT